MIPVRAAGFFFYRVIFIWRTAVLYDRLLKKKNGPF